MALQEREEKPEEENQEDARPEAQSNQPVLQGLEALAALQAELSCGNENVCRT